MRFRNALHITTDNFGSVFKLLLYRVITGVVFFSIIFVILKLSLSGVTESPQAQELKRLVVEFIRAVASGDSEYLHGFHVNFQESVKAFLVMLGENSGSIAGAIVGVAVIYLLSRFANGLAVFALGNTLNDRMSVFARTSFSSAYFKSIGKAALYQIVYVPLSFVYDALTVALCWLLCFYVPSFLTSGFVSLVVGLFCSVTAVVCLEALKMTVISAWMPAMIADKRSLGAGMKIAFTDGKQFGRRFAAFLVAIYGIVVVNAVCALVTFGSALLLTVPASFLFLLALQFVNYYQKQERKYFASPREIVGGGDAPEDAIGNK